MKKKINKISKSGAGSSFPSEMGGGGDWFKADSPGGWTGAAGGREAVDMTNMPQQGYGDWQTQAPSQDLPIAMTGPAPGGPQSINGTPVMGDPVQAQQEAATKERRGGVIAADGGNFQLNYAKAKPFNVQPQRAALSMMM